MVAMMKKLLVVNIGVKVSKVNILLKGLNLVTIQFRLVVVLLVVINKDVMVSNVKMMCMGGWLRF